jgi:predicted ATPase/DNA-binding CsgD family transcriptional regulator
MVDEIVAGGSGDLPHPVTSFVGRRTELAEVRGLLGSARLVTLTGVGGVGKSRLAVEIGVAARSAFADGVWFIDLAVVREPELVEHAVATALGVPNPSNRPTVDRLIDYLGHRQALLLFDNCEHLVDACAVLIDRLLSGCPRVRILATSRQVLDIRGENIYQAPPLPVPDPGTETSVDLLSRYESVNLLVDRAREIRPGFVVDDANGEEVARLCAQLEGIPLAIELAASRLRSLHLNELVERLEDRFGLLTSGSRTAPSRQRTLRALIDWSYDLCTPEEQLLWTRLSVFSGEFDLQAAEHVCADDDLPCEQILDLMDHIVAQSILQSVGGSGPSRFRMLMTLREYGWERLKRSENIVTVRNRHQEYFEARAVQVASAWSGPGQEAGLARLRADRGNLESALDWCISSRQAERALFMVSALRYHWCADGALSEGRRWLELALALGGPPLPERPNALWVAAWILLFQGDYSAAEARLAECDELAAEFDDDVALYMSVALSGTVQFFRGQLRGAVERLEAASAKFVALGHIDGELFTGFQIAIARVLLRDDRAVQSAQDVIAVSEQHGEQWARSRALYALGLHAWMNGDLDQAMSAARKGLQIQRGFNDHVGAAVTIELLAWIATANKQFDRAARLLGAIRSIWGAIGTSLSAFGPHLADYHTQCEQELQRGLGGLQTFQVRLDEGARMDRGQAISYALNKPQAVETPEPAPAVDVLSPRERQVAQLVAQGLSNRRIAERLVVSPRTVDGHVERILAKLEFSSRAQVAAWVASSAQG